MHSPAAGKRSRLVTLTLYVALSFATLAGCGGSAGNKQEYAYVADPEVVMRDRVAPAASRVGVIRNGERVQVLEHLQNRRFVKVRSSRGEDGWVAERYLISQESFEQLTKLAEDYKSSPAQAVAVVRRQSNLHLTPGRKTEHLYQLNENEKVELIQRTVVDRNADPKKTEKPAADKNAANGKEPEQSAPDQTPEEANGADEKKPAPEKPGQPAVLEDWWLVRDSQKRVGWVLGRALYLDVPIDIAQYAEGDRIVGFFVLDQSHDSQEEKDVPEYLVLMSENHDGLPFDYDQIRVFTWNTRRHRYETAYRERNLTGVVPTTLGLDGEVRTFALHVKDETGSVRELKYRFTPPIVRRALAPGEVPPPKPHHKPKSRRSHS